LALSAAKHSTSAQMCFAARRGLWCTKRKASAVSIGPVRSTARHIAHAHGGAQMPNRHAKLAFLEVQGLVLCIVIDLLPASRASGARCSDARASVIVHQARQAIDPAMFPASRTTHEAMVTSPTHLLRCSLTPCAHSAPPLTNDVLTASEPVSHTELAPSLQEPQPSHVAIPTVRRCSAFVSDLAPRRPVHSTAYRSADQHAPHATAGGTRGTGNISTQL
jgi:hypothetical protein